MLFRSQLPLFYGVQWGTAQRGLGLVHESGCVIRWRLRERRLGQQLQAVFLPVLCTPRSPAPRYVKGWRPRLSLCVCVCVCVCVCLSVCPYVCLSLSRFHLSSSLSVDDPHPNLSLPSFNPRRHRRVWHSPWIPYTCLHETMWWLYVRRKVQNRQAQGEKRVRGHWREEYAERNYGKRDNNSGIYSVWRFRVV